jgi:hypothetical protein
VLLKMVEATIAHHSLNEALAALPLTVADGCLKVDLAALLESKDGQLAAIDLVEGWISRGELANAEGLLALVAQTMDKKPH